MTSENSNKRMVYMGRKKCGCVVAVDCDDPKEMLDMGYVVERVPIDMAKELLKECVHK